MGGDADDESRQTISAAQLLSMGSCSAEEIGHIRLIVAWGNAFPAGTNGLSAMLEKGVELAAALQRQDTVCALQKECVELGTLMESAGDDPVDEALVKDIRKQVCEMLGRAGIDPNKSLQQLAAVAGLHLQFMSALRSAAACPSGRVLARRAAVLWVAP